MSLDDVVQVTITAESLSVARAGFGTPLIFGYHTVYAGARVREYSTSADLIADGFAATHPIVLCAQHILAQNPKVQNFKVGRRNLPHTQTVRLTPLSTVLGVVYTITVSLGLITQTYTFTNGAAETIATICTGIAAAINAGTTAVTAVAAATHVDVTVDVAGTLANYSGKNPELKIQDRTVDPGVATDLNAVLLEDPDWYAMVMDSNSEAEVNAAAAIIETVRKLLFINSADTDILDSVVTTDLFSDLEAASYARTVPLWNEELLGFAGAAWAGDGLPFDPGSITWAFKRLSSVVVDNLNTNQRSAIENKTGNFYTPLADVAVTRPGVTAANEFIDIIHYIDFLTARIQEDIASLLINNPKIPYTDKGVDLVRAEILKRLNQGIADGALAADPAPVVTAPLVKDIAAADRIARILPDVTFQATLAGAIHELQITGRLSI